MNPHTSRHVNGGTVTGGPVSPEGQHAARGENSPDRYGVEDLTTGELERTRRNLTTGLGLTEEASALRPALASHLHAVTTELGNREHSRERGRHVNGAAP